MGAAGAGTLVSVIRACQWDYRLSRLVIMIEVRYRSPMHMSRHPAGISITTLSSSQPKQEAAAIVVYRVSILAFCRLTGAFVGDIRQRQVKDQNNGKHDGFPQFLKGTNHRNPKRVEGRRSYC
jgi:hypothetical protein